MKNPCRNDALFTTAGPHYCFIHGRWGPHSADLPHIPPQPAPPFPKAVTAYSPAKQTTKLKGNFVTTQEIGVALFFAFMLGACLTGLYFDAIEKAHPCDPVPCKSVPCQQQQQPEPTGDRVHPPFRFRQFH